MSLRLKEYHNKIVNKGVEFVSTEFDKRAIRLLNLLCLYGSILLYPLILTRNIIKENYDAILIQTFAVIVFITIIYLNTIKKSQLACIIFSFFVTTLGYIAVAIEPEQVEFTFCLLAVGYCSLFLIKNPIWRYLSFGYAFITFSVLQYIQLTQREFGLVGYVLTLVVLFIFAICLRFVNKMRNKDEKIIKAQNEELRTQNEIIKNTSDQLLNSEKLRHKQELEMKRKDIEMILANNQVQMQLNENIIHKLKNAQRKGELKKNINEIILELLQQNEINTRMKLIEQNMDVVNTSFFDNLTKVYPNMTRVDKELCSYIRMGLSSKEIAVIRNTTFNSVNVTKTRLRKKLNLDKDIKISTYLKSF